MGYPFMDYQWITMALPWNIIIPWIIQGKSNNKAIKKWYDYYTMDCLCTYDLALYKLSIFNLGESSYNYSRSSHHHGYLKTVPNYPPLPFLLKRYDFIMHLSPYFQSNC